MVPEANIEASTETGSSNKCTTGGNYILDFIDWVGLFCGFYIFRIIPEIFLILSLVDEHDLIHCRTTEH